MIISYRHLIIMPPKTKMLKRVDKKVSKKAAPIFDDNSGEASSTSEISNEFVIDADKDSSTSECVTVFAKKPKTPKKAAPIKKKTSRQYCSNGKLDINTCTIVALKKVTGY